LLCGTPSSAEYRVFELVITNTQTQDVRTVLSTLDPIQYPRYYPVLATEVVSYTQTWRCYGRTGDFQPYCPNPKAQSPAPSANP
jgi:hypothetical protein